MSRPLSRPKTSAGLPLISSRQRKQQQDADTIESAVWMEQDDGGQHSDGSRQTPTTSSSICRLPAVTGAAPRLSRRPQRLWTVDPDRPPEIIGEGAFGRVFKADFMGRPVAVKEVGSTPNRLRQRRCLGDSPDHDYRRELRGADFLLELRHENVVRYLQFDTSEPGRLFVVMELIEGSNLAELRRRGPFSEVEMKSVIVQTCTGLHYLHSHRPPIVHRDVKGANIMLTKQRRVVKLVDLGLAILGQQDSKEHSSAGGTRRSLAGTYRFMAPEVYEWQVYSAKSDVFSLGCSLFELLCGQPPHADKTNEMAICYAVCYGAMPELPAWCDRRLADLYASCTQKEAALRPTAAEVLRHSYLLGVA